MARGVHRHGQGVGRRLGLGAAVVLTARSPARQPVGRRPLPHLGGRATHCCARYVRALLSHRLRRQGRHLCRHLHECAPLEQRRPIVRAARQSDLTKSNRSGVATFEEGGATGCWQQPQSMEVSMRAKMLLATVVLAAASLSFAIPRVLGQAAKLDTAAIEQATGLKGQLIADENVFKVTKPRTDVKIQVDQWAMPPFMGLGSWAAFTPAHGGGHVMMMGDTVVFEDEVNPAMSAAFEAGLEVTALHNHFFFDEPKVYFMHIGGTGEASKLAAGVKKVYDKIAEIRAANPAPGKAFTGNIASPSSINAAPLESALGLKGQASQGMFKIVIGRPATMHGVSVGKEM